MRDNAILELKKGFAHLSGPQPGPPSIPSDRRVTADHLKRLAAQLCDVQKFWREKNLGIDPLVGAYYQCVVAKSNRVQRLFSYSSTTPNAAIVGARFYKSGLTSKHLITYSVSHSDIDRSIEELLICAHIVNAFPDHQIDSQFLASIMRGDSTPNLHGLSKTNFGKLVKDACYVEKFDLTIFDEDIGGPAIVSLFNVSGRLKEQLLEEFGISISPSSVLGDAILLNERDFQTLRESAPFLIAMASVDDLSGYEPSDFDIDRKYFAQPRSIPSPQGEPTIGVIDTGFFREVYFADEWVDLHEEMFDPRFTLAEEDKAHGTAVTSIIVDGPRLNPDYDDGCGHFQVRHFVVAKASNISSFNVMKKVKHIVETNPDITVWNLSLGSDLAVRANSISPEAAILDQLQAERNIVFVVAGTNNSCYEEGQPIGAPADSINSLVVNSVDRRGKPAPYSRQGPVLSFFAKPDVSYYGGTKKDPMTVACLHCGAPSWGTSIAAPWIARKMAYLIHVMRLSPQAAKALLIHSATSWNKIEQSNVKGYGIVPIHIEDILYTNKDEIRFIITQELSSFKTYNFSLPIPRKNDKFPFKARATLCYFPTCSRNQGVDYTDCEVSLTFGRIAEKKVKRIDNQGNETIEIKPYIKPINNDSQDVEGLYTNEETARSNYRKWDNVKHIGEILKSKNPGCKVYKSPHWGIAFSLKSRLDEKRGSKLKVGLVVTLKEINNVNRFEEFRYLLQHEQWIVNSIDMHSRAKLVERATVEELTFDD